MNRMMSTVVKGIGAGMLAGIAVGAAGAMAVSHSSSRRFKKNGRRAIHAMEDLVGNVAGMIR